MRITHTQSLQQTERMVSFLFGLVQVALALSLFLAFRGHIV